MKTRRIFLLLALAFTGALNCMAQLNGTGFYRFRNAAQTTDYISIANDKFNYTTAIGDACGGLTQAFFYAEARARALECAGKYLETDIHLVDDAECIDPGSVIYAKKRNTNTNNYEYNLIGQGTSLLTLTTGTYPGTVKLEFYDRYATIKSVSGSGANTLYSAMIELKAPDNSMADLGARYLVDDNGKLAINESNSAQNAKWYIVPVNHFNVTPEVEFGGKYYTTLYVPFAFTLSNNVAKAYAVTAIAADGSVQIEEVAASGETVPAGTPVILECTSNVTADCQLIPTGEPLFTAPSVSNTGDAPTASTATNYTGNNILTGNYYCNQDGTMKYPKKSGEGSFNANHYTARTNKMYTIGITASEKLGFVKATGTAMPANKAWIEYDGTAELVLPIEDTTLKGDVNMDGQVNVADVTTLVDYILGKNPSPCDGNACDVNEDGNVNVSDVTSLVDIILNSN